MGFRPALALGEGPCRLEQGHRAADIDVRVRRPKPENLFERARRRGAVQSEMNMHGRGKFFERGSEGEMRH